MYYFFSLSVIAFNFLCLPLSAQEASFAVTSELNQEDQNKELTKTQETMTQETMIVDLEALKYAVSSKYAPKDWKKSFLNWDLEDSFQIARNKVLALEVPTAKDYQKIVKEFFASMQDYHVQTFFYSTGFSTIPIRMKSAGGKYFIVESEKEINLDNDILEFSKFDPVDLKLLNASLQKISKGDEILLINGVKPKLAVENFMKEAAISSDPTGVSIGEMGLFRRLGMFGQEALIEDIEITILKKGETNPITLTLPWLHKPEWVGNKQLEKQELSKGLNKETGVVLPSLPQGLDKDFSVRIARELKDKDPSRLFKKPNKQKKEAGEEVTEDKREKGYLPPLGEVLWESSKKQTIYAYLYKNNEGKKIGYIYLPTFVFGGEDAVKVIKEIEKAIKYFNKESEALVFDIAGNPGGSFFFLCAVLSTLSDKPLSLPTHKEMLTQEEIYRSIEAFNFLKYEYPEFGPFAHYLTGGYRISDKQLEVACNHYLNIINQWNLGGLQSGQLSSRGYLTGIEEVLPNSINYSKPLFILTDELDFSCADFFAAILQDNRRAKIFGMTTAGAGGYVNSFEHISQFGVALYSLTGSIAYRESGVPIENLGVTPDIPYQLTPRDLQDNYKDYIKTLNEEINRL